MHVTGRRSCFQAAEPNHHPIGGPWSARVSRYIGQISPRIGMPVAAGWNWLNFWCIGRIPRFNSSRRDVRAGLRPIAPKL
jgi:hypothetical protein